ncbi:hypothetical protein MINS_12510 [Mycolicibacterium insubricum]|uniref:hypothetical protein n=1 Tax=Mycolicibacterium insubricum TaxID=444597 RepID=UPI00105582A9|nr:hypothetical protein [Mycolicibacterium insubricum]MCV7080271.1 hypothetical protein [Mycolicibacterium insubricum]BBZ65822.1 hypothetical protein MINS_12510 [Mycolicibacterium insubricum]
MKSTGVAIAALLLLAGCSSAPPTPSDEEIARKTCEENLRQQAKDPDALKVEFGDNDGPESLDFSDGTTGTMWTVRGQVNGKNSFGAYEGFKSFRCYVSKDSKGEWSANADVTGWG